MGCAPVEAEVEKSPVRRAEHDLADRHALVVDVSDVRDEPRVVEGVRATERDLLLRREQELDAGVLPPFLEDAPRRLEHDDDCRLVVRAEDRPRGVAHDAILDDRVDRGFRRHRVRMRTEEDRRSSLAVRGRQVAVDVPGVAVERPGRGVLVPLETELGEVGADPIGDRALAPRRARERAELQEEVDERRGQRLLLHGAHPRPRSALACVLPARVRLDRREKRGRIGFDPA